MAAGGAEIAAFYGRGAFIVLIVVAFPKGIVGTLESLINRRKSASSKPLVTRIETAE